MVLQSILHYFFHLIFPGIIAYLFFKAKWKQAWLIMLLTMLVDLDHLFANPVFDASRNSIGFHPLHSYYAIAIYFVLLYVKKMRIIAVGLIFHMLTDYLDYLYSVYFINKHYTL